MSYYLVKASIHGGESLSLLCLCPPTSYDSVGGIIQLIVQIPVMDAVLMGYCVTDQVEIMMQSVK